MYIIADSVYDGFLFLARWMQIIKVVAKIKTILSLDYRM